MQNWPRAIILATLICATTSKAFAQAETRALAQSDINGSAQYNTSTPAPNATTAFTAESRSALLRADINPASLLQHSPQLGGLSAQFALPPLNPPRGDMHRRRNAAIGGVVGAVVGIGVCTVISSATNDAATPRISACTVKGNLLFGAGGFAVGALVGSAVR